MDSDEPWVGNMSRRAWLRLACGAGVAAMTGSAVSAGGMNRRAIPKSGETLPVVGLGTYQVFDVGTGDKARAPVREVLGEFVKLGGSVVDSSPMYGRSEGVIGDVAADVGVQQNLFLATKVWTTGRDDGIAQMNRSFQLMRTQRMDLMQVHNLLDWRVHLATLRDWKAQGKVRYIGVTHYTESGYDGLERVLRAEELDFVQLNYSIVEREAEERLLPLAAERRVAVLVNRPFAQAGLFSRVRGKSLPPWAADIGCATWAQFFLKFVVSHPAVTCAIPATSKLKHLVDNMQAGVGVMPDTATRARMARHVEEL